MPSIYLHEPAPSDKKLVFQAFLCDMLSVDTVNSTFFLPRHQEEGENQAFQGFGLNWKERPAPVYFISLRH